MTAITSNIASLVTGKCLNIMLGKYSNERPPTPTTALAKQALLITSYVVALLLCLLYFVLLTCL